MPGAQDGWDQLAEPSAPASLVREVTPRDLSHPADRPERGSLADLRRRLELLPSGHPSSPYNDDLTRKPPVPRLKDLELPLHGPQRDTNGAAKDHEPDLAGRVHTSAGTVAASPNGSGGHSAATAGLSTTEWNSTPGTPDSTPGELDSIPDEPDSTPGELDSIPDEPDSTPGRPDTTPDEPDSTPGRAAAEPGDPAGPLGDTADRLDRTPGWFSTTDWGGTADLNGWSTPNRADPARRDSALGPGWAEPEPADTGMHAVAGAKRDDAGAAPITGPDGSWEWNGRRLAAQQGRIAEAVLGRCRIAEGRNVFGGYGHSGLTPAMRRIEAQLERGQLLPDTESNALKSADRFKERLADLILRHPDKSPEELAQEVHDGIRYTFIFETEQYAEATLQAHSRLKGHGFDLEARRNCWMNAECKGISSRWRDPAHDLVFEVQFHTPASWDVRQRMRASLRQVRDPSTSPPQRARLRAVHAEMSEAIPVPPGCAAIPDYRKEGQ
jgi:hypothetical protein